MFGGDAPTPRPPALPDPLPAAPTYAAGGSAPAGTKPKPFGGTLMTGGQGVDSTTTNTARKSLLGE